MGRRKERRLAAISAASRRVKLDLSSEPSEDVGGSFSQDEVGGDGDPKTHADFHGLRASSGQQLQNPLMLLEQYSDDELDEDSKEVISAGNEATSGVVSEKGKNGHLTEAENAEKDNGEYAIIQKNEQSLMNDGPPSCDHLENLEKGSIREIDSDGPQMQTDNIEEIASHVAPDNIISGWKMVLHEESNNYYYWNVMTGETSWEVPETLDHETDKTPDENGINNSEGKLDSTKEIDEPNEEYKHDSIAADQSNEISLLGGHLVAADLCWQLMKKCENLLERLNSVSSDCNLDGHDAMKYVVEIEIRLGDIKALASHGSALLPFWLHIEARLKQLEVGIDDFIQCHDCASPRRIEANVDLQKDIDSDHGSGSSEKKPLLVAADPEADRKPASSDCEIESGAADSSGGSDPSLLSSTYPVKDLRCKSETIQSEKLNDCAKSPIRLHSGGDVDMDVDMEVEDTSLGSSPNQGASMTQICAPVELSEVPSKITGPYLNVTEQVSSLCPPEEWIPPPPPDDEPFPPPPPDDEPFPPPPPDETPDISYPQSQLGSVPLFPYSGEYTLSYPGSTLQYYEQTDLEVAGNSLYTHVNGMQAPASHVPHYYDVVSNAYSITPLVPNPVDPVAYYGLQNETLLPAPSIISETSGIIRESAPGSSNPNLVGSFDSGMESGSNLLLNGNLNVVSTSNGSLRGSAELPGPQSASEAGEISSMTNSIPVSVTSDSITIATASKSQSKVSRGKKRAVAVVSTMRSNKKVFGLVDKWKAAKEEMHEEDEESDDAYSVLEKKRQREIEEWRAQQIASGASKDNANFQPLGGDWRERVKRKKAERIKETKQSSPDALRERNPKPDLVELAKGLPSGWQAYWDEASKEVYYGNVLTSKTTWTRPKD